MGEQLGTQHSWRRTALGALCAALAASVLLTPAPAAAQSANIAINRVSGSSVYELAANVAGGSCDSKIGSHSVALTSGENWPDALAGTALDRPLLLTKQAFLPAVTRAYLEPCAEHPSAKVIILGGTAAVSENVAEALRAMGFRVDRISGADRYETARRAARTFAPDELSTVYLASGVNFADAVAVAPSVTSDTPLILSTPTELHAEARRFLTDHDIGSVTILGGRAAISDDVEAEIKDLGIETRRFAGADRYETAATIARQSFSTPGCYPVADIAVASGTVPYGGLVAGAVRGPCQPLLLAPPPTSAVPEALAAFGQDWLLAIGSSTQASVTGIGPSSDVSYDSLATVASGAVVGSGATEAEGGAQAWERVAPSVVEVQCVNENGRVVQSGSGFAVGNGRQIVTNYHIAYRGGGPCKLTRVWVGGTFNEAPQRRYTATIVRSASERDLALLALSPSAGALPAVTIATEPSKAGETITVLGYPGVGGATLTLTTGRHSGTVERGGQSWIKTDTSIAPGNSGGPAFNDDRELVGVPTQLSVSVRRGLGIIGTLGLLVPASDVVDLLAGRLGEQVGTAAPDEGSWEQGNAANTKEPYALLRTSPQRHSIPSPHDHVEPVVAVFCNDDVQIDFWDPITRRFGGPFIAGQPASADAERIGRVPVVYRIGGEGASFTRSLWWPTSTNREIVAGDEGSQFVRDLRAGSGELSFSFTSHDAASYTMEFPDVGGFATAYDNLQDRCRTFSGS
ncbi:cell wall-binding repeat-containing protein [Candidatus Poriferisodalis sp.]|uniref:cell wall-binding repeat-containing protein n=1 Tax=Candidatus Poriferisodalis sp. TaxID=3101277 RepID=UPI003B51ABA8